MKGKRTWISLLAIIILTSGILPTALAYFVPGTGETVKINLLDTANATAAPVLYPDGQEYIELNDTYTKDDTFTVWANVTDVVLLNLYGAGVTYDDTLLECTSYSEGEFFYRAPAEYRTAAVNLPMSSDGAGLLGYWNHISWALKKPGNVTGTGTLAVFDFKVLGWGVTLIDIIVTGAKWAVLKHPNDTHIDFNTIDIMFDNRGRAPAAYPPTADFDPPMPPAPWYVGQMLTFTGKNTSDEWGFTGLPDLEFCPIVLFEWDFGDGNTTTGKVATNTYVTDGDFTVNLTVTDTRGWKDWKTMDIKIFPLAVGAVLDVYTQQAPFNGTGPFYPSRPFRAGKEELVKLYAKVIYNNCPVVNKQVVFSVFQHTPPPGDPYALSFTSVRVETAFTDTSGIAAIEYRIPTGYNNEFHGAYLVYSYCFIAEALVNDATIYHVEWVNEITSVVPMPPSSWHKCETATFNVTIQSWDYIPLPVVITLHLEDDLNCTIAQTNLGPMGRPPVQGVPPGYPYDWWSPTRLFYGTGDYVGLITDLYIPTAKAWFIIGAHIPMHTYVGVGTAYVNLFDAWPIPDMFAEPLGLTGDGQPYCPQVSAPFGLES